MRKSKYIGLKSGDWKCTGIEIARVQPAYTKKRSATGKRIRSRNPGRQTYGYVFERLTHDGKAMKIITLNAAQASKVYKGLKTVEAFSLEKEAKRSLITKENICYSFCD